MRRITAVGAAIVASASVVACAADPDDSARATPTGPTVSVPAPTGPVPTVADPDGSFPANGVVASVLSLDNNFYPLSLSVAAGTEVVFENNGRNDHNVIPVGDLDTLTWGVQAEGFAPKDTYAHVFARPGTYAYYCSIHGTATAGMVGTIIVTEP